MSIKIEIPKEISLLCQTFEIKPVDLLKIFMNDLCSLPGNGGSDERSMAKDYFLRGNSLPDSGLNYDDAWHVLHQFEMMYNENYPSTSNTDYAAKRLFQLVEFQAMVKDLTGKKLKTE